MTFPKIVPGAVISDISYTGTCRPSRHGFSTVISRVSNSNISKILYKQALKITHFDENVRGI